MYVGAPNILNANKAAIMPTVSGALLAVVFSAGIGAASAAYADNILTIGSENDLYASGRDQYYTNGIRFSLMSTDYDVPDWANKIADYLPVVPTSSPDKQGVIYSFGQNLYTPDDITTAMPNPADRPYAALLYGSVGYARAADDLSRVDEVELMAGLVGPAALGEETQREVHRIVDSTNPMGWDHQLDNEPIVNAFWQRRWPNVAGVNLGTLRLSAMPHTGLAFGNAFIYGAAGGTLTLNRASSPMQDSPLRVRPSAPGTGYFPRLNRLDWQLFAGVDTRVVGRNIFLDGNTFTTSASVDKRPLVADLQAGVTLSYKSVRLSYTMVHRTKEFYGQQDANVFGAVNLSVRY